MEGQPPRYLMLLGTKIPCNASLSIFKSNNNFKTGKFNRSWGLVGTTMGRGYRLFCIL